MNTAIARLIATSDPVSARELVIECLGLSVDVELRVMTRTSSVTHVLLLGPSTDVPTNHAPGEVRAFVAIVRSSEVHGSAAE